MKATKAELGLGLNPAVDLGVDCSIGISDLNEVVFDAVGQAAIAGVDFAGKHRGTIKGLVLGFGWAGLIAAGGKSPESTPSAGIMETVINNPFWVMAAWGAAGAIYGALYSSVRGVEAYRRQERYLSGAPTEMIRANSEAYLRNTLDKLEKQAEKEAKAEAAESGENDPIKHSQRKTDILARLRLTNNAFAPVDPLEKSRPITLKTIGREIFNTTIAEGFEGLDIGVKLALVPAYYATQSQLNTSLILEAQKAGANYQKLMDMVLANNAQTIGVVILASAALIADIKTSIQQRAMKFLSPIGQQEE
ncbi:hypothetical protein HZB78_00375 [Candidatus Collierbacteria bacterium]|nr:hypothetical protein [Candidatus Collierbacteria bacterium]